MRRLLSTTATTAAAAAAAAVGKTPPINRTQESMRAFKQAMRATRLELIAKGKDRPPARVVEPKKPTRALDKNAFSAAMRSIRQDEEERPLREHAAGKVFTEYAKRALTAARTIVVAGKRDAKSPATFTELLDAVDNLPSVDPELVPKRDLLRLPRPSPAALRQARMERLRRSILQTRAQAAKRAAALEARVQKLADDVEATWSADLKQLDAVVPVNAPFLGVLNHKLAPTANAFKDDKGAFLTMFGPPRPSGGDRPEFDPRVKAVAFLNAVKLKDKEARDARDRKAAQSVMLAKPRVPPVGGQVDAIVEGAAASGVRVALQGRHVGLKAILKGALPPNVVARGAQIAVRVQSVEGEEVKVVLSERSRRPAAAATQAAAAAASVTDATKS